MYPKKHRSNSARPRGENSTPWGAPIEGLLSSGKEQSKCENDHHNVGSEKVKSKQGCNTPCRASKRIQKLRKSSGRGTNAKLVLAMETDFPGYVDPENRRRRSVRPRGDVPASWMSPDGLLQNFVTVVTKLGNVHNVVGSKRMRSTHGDTTLCGVSKDVEKVEENCGADTAQIDVVMVDALSEVTESIDEDANYANKGTCGCGTVIDTLAEVNGSDENGTEQVGETIPDASSEVKDSNRADDNDVHRMGVLMTDATAELKVKKSADADFVVQDSAMATDTLAGLKESNGAVTNALEQTAVHSTDAVDRKQGNANDAEFGCKTFSGLDLDGGVAHFDLSSAESALAALYGESDRDTCIEFAVKLLMNETPPPKQAAAVDEFFSQKMNGVKA